ncbi:MAG: hypothetical protein ACRDTJ_02370 [Pseudonocardiaceae bacterium]
MTTVDYLGPSTPETRAEVKSARRALARKSAKELAVAYLLFALLAAFFALGTLVGNVTDSDVRDIDIPVPSPSGERAEPEHVPGLTLERGK